MGQVDTQEQLDVPLETIRALGINNIHSGPKTHRGMSSGVDKRRKVKSLGTGHTVGNLNIQSIRNKTDIIRDIYVNHNVDMSMHHVLGMSSLTTPRLLIACETSRQREKHCYFERTLYDYMDHKHLSTDYSL